jgi:hypothetical protein
MKETFERTPKIMSFLDLFLHLILRIRLAGRERLNLDKKGLKSGSVARSNRKKNYNKSRAGKFQMIVGWDVRSRKLHNMHI